jgi:probable phosphoglycerate mutase
VNLQNSLEAKSHGLEIIPHKGLREIYAGKWEGEIFDDLVVKYTEDFNRWKTDVGRARCTDGESVAELFDRVTGTLASIAAENEGKTVCIATHATPIRTVTAAALTGRVDDMADLPWSANASINIFDFEDGKFTAVALSLTDHLGDLSTALPSNV